jgi:hypothetical protein
VRAGLLPVVALGLITVVLRAMGSPSLADLGAMAYLVAATAAFGSMNFRLKAEATR